MNARQDFGYFITICCCFVCYRFYFYDTIFWQAILLTNPGCNIFSYDRLFWYGFYCILFKCGNSVFYQSRKRSHFIVKSRKTEKDYNNISRKKKMWKIYEACCTICGTNCLFVVLWKCDKILFIFIVFFSFTGFNSASISKDVHIKKEEQTRNLDYFCD